MTSDPVQIANLIVTCITTLGLAWIGYLTLKVRSGQKQNAVDREESANDVKQRIDEVKCAVDGQASIHKQDLREVARQTLAVKQEVSAVKQQIADAAPFSPPPSPSA